MSHGCKCTIMNNRKNTDTLKNNFTQLSLCREEVRLLKEELTEEYDADKQAALTQLSQQKELEMMAAREGWQRKVEDLLEQVKHTWTNTHSYCRVGPMLVLCGSGHKVSKCTCKSSFRPLY